MSPSIFSVFQLLDTFTPNDLSQDARVNISSLHLFSGKDWRQTWRSDNEHPNQGDDNNKEFPYEHHHAFLAIEWLTSNSTNQLFVRMFVKYQLYSNRNYTMDDHTQPFARTRLLESFDEKVLFKSAERHLGIWKAWAMGTRSRIRWSARSIVNSQLILNAGEFSKLCILNKLSGKVVGEMWRSQKLAWHSCPSLKGLRFLGFSVA